MTRTSSWWPTTFRRFAEERIAPEAERIHRQNVDIPEGIISGLGELGAFGLSIPEAYGGYATGGEHDYLGMVVATEELSRASLGAGGSLITRPEILARALLRGGTEAQKQAWLPRLATGEIMAGVAVTEPDFGSDVAGISVTAGRTDGGDWLLRGTKTWSTFAARADVLMLLARTDPDRTLAHRGLSIFVVPKARANGGGFVLTQPGGGRLEGRPIDTIGYRGMHSFELSFDDWLVPGKISSVASKGWAGASTCRWRASKTVGSRRQPEPSGSCRRPTRRPAPMRPDEWCSAARSATTS